MEKKYDPVETLKEIDAAIERCGRQEFIGIEVDLKPISEALQRHFFHVVFRKRGRLFRFYKSYRMVKVLSLEIFSYENKLRWDGSGIAIWTTDEKGSTKHDALNDYGLAIKKIISAIENYSQK